MNYQLHQIGLVHSPFKEKFGIPRQTGLIKGCDGFIELQAPWDRQEALQGLEGFSHLWIVFIFHQAIKPKEKWRPTVRPPRLGAKRQGVFATRSPYRPNPIGMSVVEYHGWEKRGGKLCLKVSGLDLLHETPVVDIKPYLPYADSLPEAQGGFAHQAPKADEALSIIFSEQAAQQIQAVEREYPKLKLLIETTVGHNPRPAYFGKAEQRTSFGMQLYDFKVQWQITDDLIEVLSI